MMPAPNSIAALVMYAGRTPRKGPDSVGVRSLSVDELRSLDEARDDIARAARRGVRAGGDGLSPIRALIERYGPMLYDPEAIAAVAGVHVDLVRAMARLGFLNICDGWVLTVKAGAA